MIFHDPLQIRKLAAIPKLAAIIISYLHQPFNCDLMLHMRLPNDLFIRETVLIQTLI